MILLAGTKDSPPAQQHSQGSTGSLCGSGSEGIRDPNPDGEGWPQNGGNYSGPGTVNRLHALGLQLASPDTVVGFLFQDSDRDSWKHIRAGCVQQIHVEKICCLMSGTSAEHFSISLFAGYAS